MYNKIKIKNKINEHKKRTNKNYKVLYLLFLESLWFFWGECQGGKFVSIFVTSMRLPVFGGPC
jgi:hypothetical protein